MARFNCDLTAGIDDIGNGVALRADVRRLLDSHRFVFVPIEGTMVAHVLDFVPDYAQTLHNRPVDMPLRVPIAFVYARFAFNVLSRAQEVIAMLSKRSPATVPVPKSLQKHARDGTQKKHSGREGAATTMQDSVSEQDGEFRSSFLWIDTDLMAGGINMTPGLENLPIEDSNLSEQELFKKYCPDLGNYHL